MAGCVDRPRFLICPSEYANEIRSESRLGQMREILFRDKEYAVLVFEMDPAGYYVPVQHYRPEHTFTDRERPDSVSWNSPLHVSTIIIIDSPEDRLSVAVKKSSELGWRQYHTNRETIVGDGEMGIVYLPPFDELTPIPEAMLKIP